MAIVIRKKVSLDFLGEEYKGAELYFRAIPMKDYEQMMDELPKTDPRLKELATKEELTDIEQKELDTLADNAQEENKKNIGLILRYLKKYFISGQFPNFDTNELEKVTDAEELDNVDQDTALRCFGALTGGSDPKDSEK